MRILIGQELRDIRAPWPLRRRLATEAHDCQARPRKRCDRGPVASDATGPGNPYAPVHQVRKRHQLHGSPLGTQLIALGWHANDAVDLVNLPPASTFREGCRLKPDRPAREGYPVQIRNGPVEGLLER